jgi:hypothetical protein
MKYAGKTAAPMGKPAKNVKNTGKLTQSKKAVSPNPASGLKGTKAGPFSGM